MTTAVTLSDKTREAARLRNAAVMIGVLALVLLFITMTAPPSLNFTDEHSSRLSIHLLMELGAICVAMLIVAVSWHTIDAKDAGASNILVYGFLVVACCDIVHALTYEGMPALLGEGSTPRSIFFWLMGRSFEVATMALIAVNRTPGFSRGTCLGAAVLTATLLVWFGSYHLEMFPATFVPGLGVTPFKSNYEYALCLLNLLVAMSLWRQAAVTGQPRFYLLALSSFVMGIGELAFTSYLAPSDFQNVFGHSYKLAAYGLLYWATFITGIRAPFEAVRESEAHLRESELRMRSLSDNLPGCMVYQIAQDREGNKRFIHVSEAVRKLNGLTVEDVMRDSSLLYKQVLEEDRGLLLAAEQQSAEQLSVMDVTVRLVHADGRLRWIQLCSAPRRLADGSIVWDGVEIDVSERKLAEGEINRLGFYDQLTGLPNRRLLIDRLHQAVAASGRTRHLGALLFIDLDNFKVFNDTLGHDMGDLLLKQVAARLVDCVREIDTVSRFGGDEFVVMLQDLGEVPGEAALKVTSIGHKLLASLDQPLDLDGEQRFTSLSVGATLFGDQKQTTEEILQAADLAMYEAKAAGRNTLRFFDPQMQASVNARSMLEADLRIGVQSQQFVVHYQAQVDGQGKTIGVEALVRWQHPERGMVSPAEFIPLAEETGLILPIGRWVLESACRQIASWQGLADRAHLTVAVNVSARQLDQANFVDEVLAAIESTGANPLKLKLELTESLLLDNADLVIEKMTALKAHGVGFSLDDFGTGYSSLSYLKRLPLDQLKIDQSFVRDILTDPNDAAIAATIIALGRSLDLQVIAEGVETEGQRALLAAQGCHTYQGYLFGRPGLPDVLPLSYPAGERSISAPPRSAVGHRA